MANEVWSVALPRGAEPPYRVYVNGEERHEGVDFSIGEGVLRFTRPLRAQPPLGLGRKVMLAIGIGVYGDLKGDSVDIQYTVGGQPRLATNVPLSPGGGAAPPPG